MSSAMIVEILTLLEEQVDKDSNRLKGQLYFVLAICKSLNKEIDFEEILLDIDKSLLFCPKDVNLLVLRYNINFRKQRHTICLQDINRLLRIDDTSPEYHLQRARIYNATDEYELAIQDFKKCLELGMKKPEVYVSMGNAKSQNDDQTGAIELYNKALEIQEDYIGAYYYKAWAKSRMNPPDLSGAIEDLDIAFNDDTSDVRFTYKLGELLYKNGDLMNAKDKFIHYRDSYSSDEFITIIRKMCNEINYDIGNKFSEAIRKDSTIEILDGIKITENLRSPDIGGF
jgi:tetratricopeptide (TPR) repeat protein